MAKLTDPIAWLEYSLRNLAGQKAAWSDTPTLIEKLLAIVATGKEKFGANFPGWNKIVSSLGGFVQGNTAKMQILRQAKQFFGGTTTAAATAPAVVGGVAAGAGEAAAAVGKGGRVAQALGKAGKPDLIRSGGLMLGALLLSDLLKSGMQQRREVGQMDVQAEMMRRMAELQTPESFYQQAMLPMVGQRAMGTHQAALAQLLGMDRPRVAMGDMLIGGQ